MVAALSSKATAIRLVIIVLSKDFIYISLLILPIIVVIFLNSTIYNGWRHLYFIYPCLLIFSVYGLDKIKIKFFKNKEKFYNILILLFIFQVCFVMVKNHPYQNVFFNFVAGKNVKKNFEIDYWGLSNKQALELILKNDKRNLIKIGSAGPISLNNRMKILSKKSRDRLIVSQNIDADYIINNYIDWHGKYKKKRYIIPDNFTIYSEISTHKTVINTIYKKN